MPRSPLHSHDWLTSTPGPLQEQKTIYAIKVISVCPIWEPTVEEVKAGKKATLIVEPKTVLCADDKSAMVLAARAIPENYLNQLDQVQVVVRPF